MSATGIKMIGNWSRQVDVPLQNAMALGMEMSGESGAKACRRAILWMANAAKKITPIAPKKRKVMRDSGVPGRGGEYFEAWPQGKDEPTRIYRFMFSGDDRMVPGKLRGTFEQGRTVGNRGLARRAWFWGMKPILKRLPDKRPGIPGVSWLRTIAGKDEGGYEYFNSLDYITKIMPGGWESQVHRAVSDRIMAAEANKLMRRWGTSVREIKRAKGIKRTRDVARYFFDRAQEEGIPL